MHRGNGKPRIHARDHEHGGADPTLIVYEDVGVAGGGGATGIQFELYPQTGGWLNVETTSTADGTSTGNGINLIADIGDIQFDATARDITMNAGRDIKAFPDRDYIVSADRDVNVTADGDLSLRAATGNILLPFLPTSLPASGGCLWNDGGTLKIS